MRNGLKWLSVLTSAGMFLVLIAGALVTKTESGRGCGDDWPLCNGKFIPAYTIESMIEYSHRAVSGIVGLLVLATAIWVWKSARQRKDAVFYAFGALFFTMLQAVLGAMAVVWEQSSAVMALHFGFSLIAFACTLLLAITMWKAAGGHVSGERPGQGGKSSSEPVSLAFRNFIWSVTLYCYVVVYIGAYVRHTRSSGGCIGWPLCNGELIPPLSGATGIAFAHRLAAVLLFIVILCMGYLVQRYYRGNAGFRRGSQWAILLVSLQIASGGLVASTMNTDLYIFSGMLHAVLIAALFGVLCYLSVIAAQLYRGGSSRGV